MRSLSVSWRLVLLFLVAATPVFVLHVWTALDQRTQLRTLAEDQLVRSARLLSAQQQLFFRSAGDVLTAALVIADEVTAGPPCDGVLARLAAANVAFDYIGVTVPDGSIVCSSDPSPPVAFEGTPHFVGAFEAAELAVGMPTAHVLPIALALRESATEPTAVAVGALNLRRLSETMTLSRLPADAVGVVFNASRSVLARLSTGATIEEAAFAPVGPDIALSAGGTGLVEAIDRDGRSRLWAVSDVLPEQGLYVAIGVGVAGLFADADAVLWRGIAILMAVFVATGLLAWQLSETMISRPLARLKRAVATMRSGDYAVRVEHVSAAKELRELEEGFNSMVAVLKAHEYELQERNVRLNQLVGEKEMLVREMNHRIKNSLQLVSSLISLQREDLTDKTAAAGLLDAQTRVSAIAKVHERLYASNQMDRVAIGPFIRGLCSDLAKTVESEHGDGQVIRVVSAEAKLSPDTAIPLGMIVTELVTNAMKHAAAAEDGGVAVTIEDAGNDALRLTVSDNGPGFPEGFEFATAPHLGLRIATNLAAQLGSTLEIDRSAAGARVTMTFDVSDP